MADFYSCAFNIAFNSNKDDHMELEVAFEDSDGIEVGAYSEGDDIVKLIYDVADELDAAIADAGDAKADESEIDRLYARIQQLEAENANLKNKIDPIKEKNFNFKEDKKEFGEKIKLNVDDRVAQHDTYDYLNNYLDETYNDFMKKLKVDLPAYSNILKGII